MRGTNVSSLRTLRASFPHLHHREQSIAMQWLWAVHGAHTLTASIRQEPSLFIRFLAFDKFTVPPPSAGALGSGCRRPRWPIKSDSPREDCRWRTVGPIRRGFDGFSVSRGRKPCRLARSCSRFSLGRKVDSCFMVCMRLCVSVCVCVLLLGKIE